MTKTQITAAIDTALGIVITKAKVLASLLNFTNEIYSEEITDSNTSETYTTKAGSSIAYTLVLKKLGNQVIIKIGIRNTTSSTIGGSDLYKVKIFDWKDSPYKPNTSNNIKVDVYGYSGIPTVQVFLDETGVWLISSLQVTSSLLPYFQSNFNSYITRQL